MRRLIAILVVLPACAPTAPPRPPLPVTAPRCEVPPSTPEPDDPNDPDVIARQQRDADTTLPADLVARLEAAFPTHHPACGVTLRGPCSARGDLDGDHNPDDIVPVRSDSGEGGFAILWARGGADLLGAGKPCQFWTVRDGPNNTAAPTLVELDLDWIRDWTVWPRVLRDGRPVFVGRHNLAHDATSALGDGLMIDGGDAAALVHRDDRGWAQLHLGF